MGGVHCLYFGVMFSPLIAEIGYGHSIWSAASLVRQSSMQYPLPDELQASIPLLGHYGIKL